MTGCGRWRTTFEGQGISTMAYLPVPAVVAVVVAGMIE